MPAPATLPRNETGIAAALGILAQRFGERFSRGEDIRRQHGHTMTWLANQPPDAVVFAETTEEVAETVRICADHGVPVIPFGTGTSLEGHLNAPAGGVSIDLARMDQVLRVNAEDLDVVVQPGVTRRQLNEYLRDTGLFFAVDPGADASLGGMAATRASGTNAVRYGTMRDNVVAVEAVLADGTVIRTGGRARKSSAGYDLTRLLVGSEGTLGIITELTLRLHGIPEAISGARCSFPSVEAAAEAVIMTIQIGLPVARIELLDAMAVGAINAYSKLDLPETPLLLLEFHGSEAGVAEQAETFREIAVDAGGTGFAASADAEERGRIWRARHDAYWALRALEPGSDALSTDVCVPISRLAEMISATAEKAREMGITAPILGHAGDGNFHAIFLLDPADPGAAARAERLIGWMSETAIAMEGTVTGEHGIGQGKAAYLDRELGPATDVMRAIKRALDPQDILNPGKIVP
ncbi:MAG: FAD-linked oxidase C-terminal domain-containing protein [Paracoccaceae bacterium]|nr:FAD-linked oxidase C-terminal domain-containing protein [Paracoccaceae bacterium]